METKTIKMELPKDIFLALRKYDKDVEKGLRVFSSLFLFKTRRFSLGKAKELSDPSLSEFMELTRRERIPIRDYSEEEIKEEIEGAKRIAKRLRTRER
ncbi:MAG: UPF0175 family protein [bacterium]